MKTTRRILALLFALLMVFSLSACGDDDDDVVLTTKKKVTTTASTDTGIDIWSYLNGDVESDNTAEPGTIAYSGGSYSGGVSTYEDTPISFAGGSSVISSSTATTNKSGYPVIKWSAVSGAVKYNIYRSTNKSSGYTYLDSTTETTYTDKTAVSGTQYYYQVKAVKKAPTQAPTPTQTPTQKPTINPGTTAPSVTVRDVSNFPANGTIPNSTNITDIVTMYNLSANQVKAKATSVTLQSRTIKYIESPSSEFKTILGLIGVKEGTSNNPHAYVGHDKVIAEFPIENSETSSTLQVGMVSSASCTYENGYYTVVINLKPDPEGTVNYSKTCTDVIDISGWYTGAYSTTKGVVIQARISYDGYLDYVSHYVPTYIYVNNTENGDQAVTVNTVVGFSIQEFWSINY